MKTGLVFLGGAILGLAAGIIGTKAWFKSNYEEVEVKEEPKEEVKEENKNEKEEIVIRSTDQKEYKQKLEELRYNRVLEKYNEDYEEDEYEEDDKYEGCHDIIDDCPPVVDDPTIPYKISREEFMAYDAYESDEYTIYADGYVTDSYGIPISKEDIERLFGPNLMEIAGSVEDGEDEFCIRNQSLKLDFNVLIDDSNFVDVAPLNIKKMMGL